MNKFELIRFRQKQGAREPVDLSKVEATESDVARAFTVHHGDFCRFDHDQGRWFEWQGDVWKPDTTNRAADYCRELAEDVSATLPSAERVKIRRSSFAKGVEYFARNDQVHAIRSDDWDSDPWALGCPNGVVDLRTGDVLDPHPGQLITRQAAVAPAAAADCPLWLKFLEEATGGDWGLIGFLQRWCGYCLTGVTREHALVFVYGPGGNGKSVFLNTVTGLLSDYAAVAAMDAFTASKGDRHPTDLAMLQGARLVTASETEEGRAWAESRIKQMTGGDPITARFMRKDFFTYRPQFKLTIVGNHAPVLHNVDEAARRRFNIVNFTIKPQRPDPRLEDKLSAEWPGILRWMIDGCLQWQAEGLKRPESVIAATAEYFAEQDLIGQWLADECRLEPGNAARWATSAELFGSWSAYAKATGEEPGTAKAFGGKLARHGLRRITRKLYGKAVKAWEGVEIVNKAVGHDHDR